jgi:hypothetical protein
VSHPGLRAARFFDTYGINLIQGGRLTASTTGSSVGHAPDPAPRLRRPGRGGTAAWCGIAEEIESINDQMQSHQAAAAFYTPQERHTSTPCSPTPQTSSTPPTTSTPHRHPLQDQATWQLVVETAAQHGVARRPIPTIDHDLGLGL